VRTSARTTWSGLTARAVTCAKSAAIREKMTMTDPAYRHYLLIVDRSGSMEAVKTEAQEGIRRFAREQAALPGKATLTLVQFDNKYETVYDFASLDVVAFYELMPRYMTALLDACGAAVTGVTERLAALPESERPGKVIVLITTDGKENQSREYTREQVNELFTRQQEEYGWQFLYVGANVDAFAEAGGMGIHADSTLSYAATRRGTTMSYAAASASSSRYASGQSVTTAFTDEEREEAADKK
jgi:uncharacterized protein YegL